MLLVVDLYEPINALKPIGNDLWWWTTGRSCTSPGVTYESGCLRVPSENSTERR